jgi:porin
LVLTFAAPPSGAVPPYLFGALMSVRTKPATFGLWVYDPVSVVNKTGFEEPFAHGVSVRGSVDFPVSIGGLSGRQGFSALYSTEPGTDLSDTGDTFIPPFPPGSDLKNGRYHLSYSFDQYLYRVSQDSKEGFGLFGQFGISDGNPNKLYWSGLVGIGGTGLIPGRSEDNWGIAYYYNAPSRDLKKALAPILTISDEQGAEAFYNFEATPWQTFGADLQVINPTLAKDTAVYFGLRSVTRL